MAGMQVEAEHTTTPEFPMGSAQEMLPPKPSNHHHPNHPKHPNYCHPKRCHPNHHHPNQQTIKPSAPTPSNNPIHPHHCYPNQQAIKPLKPSPSQPPNLSKPPKISPRKSWADAKVKLYKSSLLLMEDEPSTVTASPSPPALQPATAHPGIDHTKRLGWLDLVIDKTN